MSNYYVKFGLAGYGPDLQEEDYPHEGVQGACYGIQYELDSSIDSLYELSHIEAEAEEWERAYKCRAKADELEALKHNLDWDRRALAPLYVGNLTLLEESMTKIIEENFPLDVDLDGYNRVYVWITDDEVSE